MDNFNNSVFLLLEESDTNWLANKFELVGLELDKGLLMTDSFGIFRSDNNKWLGTVGSQYLPMQNHELAEVIVALQDSFGGEVTGGQLQDGKRIYYQNSLPNEAIENDVVKRNITCLNSHNGSSAIGFGSTNTVISCSNTFHKAMRELARFRHTATASERLAVAVSDFKKAMTFDEELMTTYKRMTEVKINKPIVSEIIERLFKVTAKDKVGDISTRRVNKLKRFNEALDHEIGSKGSSVWGLFNAVTYYTNHLEVPEAQSKLEDKKIDHLMIGGGYLKNLLAYDILSTYVQNKKQLLVGV